MPTALELRGLAPHPHDEWNRMLRFVGWSASDCAAAARSAETLLRRGAELVAETYNYLRQVPETAAILGWDQRVDPAHLEERRRFFTLWLARTIGLDTGGEFALYLFRAGKYHAGHGPRRIHTPPSYVTGSVGLVLAAFARYMAEAGLPGDTLAESMAAWNKFLAVQLNQMLLGYQAAREIQRGDFPVRCAVFGRLRPLVGLCEISIRADQGAHVGDLLRKFFDYCPEARPEALERVWQSEESNDSLWIHVAPAYVPRPGWRLLLNGRDIAYADGLNALVHERDELAIFPPGR